ncbi:DEAD/DEAH box helicase family protein [Jannaschia sp. R86511]|uniref:TOTE conflict system archaeo-eukaryotic primase domain-containing protein n=1 Tax=Jannaschia sp. R86511 TaxID=3093853 RepID=UPI0036D39FC2
MSTGPAGPIGCDGRPPMNNVPYEGGGHEGLLAEVKALRAENDRLRGLLGLQNRAENGHSQAGAPILRTAPDEPRRVDSSSTPADKLALWRSLFGARSDVYATRWQSASSGKSGWSPASKDRWANGRPPRNYLPLTDEVFVAHLRGVETVGIYPLLHEDACALLVCDFDKGTWALDALAYLDACHRNAVPAALERSRSGDGAHVWVFFAQPVPASSARAMGAALLREAMTARAELDLSSYDRFFPSQDFMPKAGFGNLIALPLQGGSIRKGTTLFVDPTTMQPWPDQWAFLSSVTRMSPQAVESVAETLRPVDTGPTLPLTDLGRAGGPPAPPVVRARLGAELSIERAGLPPAVVAALKHAGSIPNPEYFEKQRLRFSTWDTPRFISAYREDLQWLHLPRGLIDSVRDLFASIGSSLAVIDDRPEPPIAAFAFRGELRAQQAVAVADVIEHELGVLVAPPGAGKTVMACAVIAHRRTPTLVVVDRKELLEQWRSRLHDHLGLDASDVGQIGGGRDQATGVIDVAMIQSLARRDNPSFFDRYGLVVVDECHHLPAASFTTCMRAARTRRWLGLTATPYRRDKLEALIAFQCGPTRHEIKPATVEGTELMRRELVAHHTSSDMTGEDTSHIQDVFRVISDDATRTAQICADVHDACSSGRTCLVLTQRTDHIEAIRTGLATLGQDALVLRGGLGRRAREAVTAALAAREPDNGIVLIATGSYLGEGFDWPELDTLFLAFPLAFKGRVVQYVGRLLRSHEGKHHVVLHDYVDHRIPVLERMHRKRLPAYATLGSNSPSPAVGSQQRAVDRARTVPRYPTRPPRYPTRLTLTYLTVSKDAARLGTDPRRRSRPRSRHSPRRGQARALATLTPGSDPWPLQQPQASLT